MATLIKHQQRWLASLALLAAMTLAGCGFDGRVAVQGTVRLDGRPIERGAIRFLHGGEGPTASAMIEQGRYQLQTIAGKKKVEIEGYEIDKHLPADPLTGAPAHPVWRQMVPSRYNTKSQLQVEIIDRDEPFDFDLESVGVKNASTN